MNPFLIARIVLGALIVAALIGLGYKSGHDVAQHRIDDIQHRWDQERALSLQAAAKAEAEARATEDQRVQAAQEIDHVSALAVANAATDSRAAGAALDRLRQRTASAARSCGATSNPTAAAVGPAAGPAADLPADVLGRVGEAAGQLAEQADRAMIAGAACEKAYGALITP